MMAAKHHYSDCTGKHTNYVKLVVIANCMLQQDGMLDTDKHTETSTLLDNLGISVSDAEMILEEVLACRNELGDLARGLMVR